MVFDLLIWILAFSIIRRRGKIGLSLVFDVKDAYHVPMSVIALITAFTLSSNE